MKYTDYYASLSAAEKRELAERLDTSVAYLSQLASGHRRAGASILLRIEAATDGQVSPQEMRSDQAA